MTAPVFGETSLCRRCGGTGIRNGRPGCDLCQGSGVLRAPTRSGDPETSFAAAASVSREAVRADQRLVYRILRAIGPATDEQLYRHLSTDMSPSGARTRRNELVAMGRVADTGRTERLASGRFGIVWTVVESPLSPTTEGAE